MDTVRKLFLLMVLAGLTIMVSCKHKSDVVPDKGSSTVTPPPPPPPPDTTITTQPCSPDTVYFVNQILPLLSSSCAYTGCHDSASHVHGLILNKYNLIRSHVQPGNPSGSSIYTVLNAGGDDIMPPPPNAPLTPAQINLIYTWIMQGAQNNYCPNLDCDSSNVTFSGTIFPLIKTYCIGCHSGSNIGGGISLANYSDIAANANAMWQPINHLGILPFMPVGTGKLPQCKINQIHKWMTAGMPNN